MPKPSLGTCRNSPRRKWQRHSCNYTIGVRPSCHKDFRDFIPEGCPKIAQRFNRWVKECEAISSPDEGTEEPVSRHSFAPFGAWSVRDTSIPAINRWAIVDRPCGTGTAHVASIYLSRSIVNGSNWPLKYFCRASLKTALSDVAFAKRVIEERNFRSSGYPKISSIERPFTRFTR